MATIPDPYARYLVGIEAELSPERLARHRPPEGDDRDVVINWRPDNYAMFKTAFPHLPLDFGSQQPRSRRPVHAQRRRAVYHRYNDLRLLRNRIFHFEPIWDRPALGQQYRDALEAIGWINPLLRDTVESRGLVEEVLADRRANIQDFLDGWLGYQ